MSTFPQKRNKIEEVKELTNKRFSEISQSPENVWFSGSIARASELGQRKSEGLSLARAYGINRKKN